MRNIVRGEAFKDRLSDFDRESLSISADAPSAEARGERALDRGVVALAVPTLVNQPHINLLPRYLVVAMKLATKITLLIARGPSGVIFIMSNADVVVVSETLP